VTTFKRYSYRSCLIEEDSDLFLTYQLFTSQSLLQNLSIGRNKGLFSLSIPRVSITEHYILINENVLKDRVYVKKYFYLVYISDVYNLILKDNGEIYSESNRYITGRFGCLVWFGWKTRFLTKRLINYK
jgi:hypothetical protein